MKNLAKRFSEIEHINECVNDSDIDNKYQMKMWALRLRRKTIWPIELYLRFHWLEVILFILAFVVGVLLGKVIFTEKPEMLSPGGGSEVKQPIIEVLAEEVKGKTWTGVASYYSREGCVGCSANLHMANGQDLVDENLTVAFNKLKLGRKVRITNLKNGQSVVAKVTDTGGFERLGRIIDLTVGTKMAIKCSDLCQVRVEEII